MAVIAIEEHFTSPELRKVIAPRAGPIQKMLDDDEHSVHQGHGRGRHRHRGDVGEQSRRRATSSRKPRSKMAKASNDFLARDDQGQSDALQGLRRAAVARPQGRRRRARTRRHQARPARRDDHGHQPGASSSTIKKFWPVFERAAKLDVPVYIHPSPIKPALVEAFFHGPRRGAARLAARLRPGDADPHVPPHHLGAVRPVSDPRRSSSAISARPRRTRCGAPTTTSPTPD